MFGMVKGKGLGSGSGVVAVGLYWVSGLFCGL